MTSLAMQLLCADWAARYLYEMNLTLYSIARRRIG